MSPTLPYGSASREPQVIPITEIVIAVAVQLRLRRTTLLAGRGPS
jgi:hypothetical protein